MNQQMAYCAQERVLVTVENAFVLLKNGIFRENSVTVTTETVTNMMGSFAQGMEYVAVATVNAGMDGMEMHVKSGLAQNILNNYMGKDWILIFPMPLEYINTRETIYNHHGDRSNRLLYVFLFLNA